MPLSSAATFSLGRSATSTPPWYFSARTVATITAADGAQPRWPAHDVDELLGAEIRAESGLGDDVVGELQRRTRRHDELQPCAMFANGPPCTNAGVFSSVCTRFGASASRRIAVIAPCASRSRARTGCRSRV